MHPGCRRKLLLAHFGERRGACNAAAEQPCDFCRDPRVRRPANCMWGDSRSACLQALHICARHVWVAALSAIIRHCSRRLNNFLPDSFTPRACWRKPGHRCALPEPCPPVPPVRRSGVPLTDSSPSVQGVQRQLGQMEARAQVMWATAQGTPGAGAAAAAAAVDPYDRTDDDGAEAPRPALRMPKHRQPLVLRQVWDDAPCQSLGQTCSLHVPAAVPELDTMGLAQLEASSICRFSERLSL